MTLTAITRISPIVMACLAAITILGFCRLGLNASFWLGLMGHAHDANPALMLCIGACFTLLEMFGMRIRDQLAAYPKIAVSWLVLWLFIVILSLFADMSGIAEILHKDTTARNGAQTAYSEKLAERDAASARRDKYAAVLDDQNLDLPLPTLQAHRASLLLLIERRGDKLATYNQQVELGRLNAAIETAIARDEAEAERGEAQAALNAIGAPPTALPASFGEIARLLGMLHVSSSADQVHAGFVFLLALVIQATLIVGPRALLRLASSPSTSLTSSMMTSHDQSAHAAIKDDAQAPQEGRPTVTSPEQPRRSSRPHYEGATGLEEHEIDAILGLNDPERASRSYD